MHWFTFPWYTVGPWYFRSHGIMGGIAELASKNRIYCSEYLRIECEHVEVAT